MYNEVITLIAETKTTNEYGDLVSTEARRTVFAELKSITQSEFYQASASGFKPEIKFVLPDYLDYEGEMLVEYQPYDASAPARYSVIRTYRNNNTMELVCRRGVDE